MGTLRTLRDAVLSRREERRRRSRLRRELLGYRTPAERDELLAILGRYDMTIEDVIAGREPPPLSVHSSPERWEQAWDDIVLDLSSQED
jgi:hypothetical protein